MFQYLEVQIRIAQVVLSNFPEISTLLTSLHKKYNVLIGLNELKTGVWQHILQDLINQLRKKNAKNVFEIMSEDEDSQRDAVRSIQIIKLCNISDFNIENLKAVLQQNNVPVDLFESVLQKGFNE